MHNQQNLIVFARAPEYGLVKRRLAADIGKQQALDFYKKTLRTLLEQMDGGQWHLTVAADTASAKNHALFKNLDLIVQPEGDLGHRMATILDHFRGSPRIIIGSDIPSVRPRHVQRAFEVLSDHDVVFGPAQDGGFWLVGCSADFDSQFSTDRLFAKGIRWSTDQTLSDTLSTLPTDCRVAHICTLSDVDDGTSYQQHLSDSEHLG